MTGSTRLIGLGLAVFMVTLVAGVPASAAIGWLAPDGMRIGGASGTLWSGSARRVSIGDLGLGETRWRVSLLRLLIGQLAARIETGIGDSTATGDIAVSLSGNITCTACSYTGRVADLRPLIPALSELDGRVAVDVVVLEIEQQWPKRLIGTVELSDVPLDVTAASNASSALAAFSAGFNNDPVAADGLIEATVEDAGGPVEVRGRLTVTPAGQVTLTGRAASRPGAPEAVVNALSVLGQKASDGSTEFSLSGTF